MLLTYPKKKDKLYRKQWSDLYVGTAWGDLRPGRRKTNDWITDFQHFPGKSVPICPEWHLLLMAPPVILNDYTFGSHTDIVMCCFFFLSSCNTHPESLKNSTKRWLWFLSLKTHPFCHVTPQLLPLRDGDSPALWIWAAVVVGFGHWKVVEVMLGRFWVQPPEARSTAALSSCHMGELGQTHWRMEDPGEHREAILARAIRDQPCPSSLARSCDRWVRPGETGRSTLGKDARAHELSERPLCWAAKVQTGCYFTVCKTLVPRLGPTSRVPGQHQGAHTVGGSLLLSFHGSSFPSSLLTALQSWLWIWKSFSS